MSFDLRSLIEIQKSYLTDLSAISMSLTPDEARNIYSDLQTDLSGISTTLINHHNRDLYNNVSNVSSVLDKEAAFLNEKNDEIKTKITSQQRLIELNDSQRKKQTHYNYIIFIIIIALILFIILYKIRIWLPFIPEFVITLLMVIVLSVSLVYIVILFYNIRRRDNLNFDNIILSSPRVDDSEERQKAIDSGDLLKSFNTADNCVGQDCCSSNSIWNPYIKKCDVKCVNPESPIAFNGACTSTCDTTINQLCGSSCIPKTQTCYNMESMVNLEVNGKISPYTPFEFVSYSRY